MTEITALGALSGLAIAIFLILKQVAPAYGMMVGAFVGALIGMASITETISLMVGGVENITPSILRILTAGILAGVLIESGAARVIANRIIRLVGEKHALIALILSTTLLTGVGVFVDVAVITVAPIALAVVQQTRISVLSALVAMVGGGKAGNIISPNPNTIAAADAFDVPLTSLMTANLLPALIGVICTYIIARTLVNKGKQLDASFCCPESTNQEKIPALAAALTAPLVAILLLSLRPIAGIVIDPMIALPTGGIVGALVMGQIRDINHFAMSGLNRMTGVAIMLIGTGTLAGVIANSALSDVLVDTLKSAGLPSYLLAPFSGMMMSGAAASTTAGTALASTIFGPIILQLGIPALGAGAMVHAGATVFDHMPHGSFFHATGGSVGMNIKERLQALPFESLIGFSMALTSTIMYGIFS